MKRKYKLCVPCRKRFYDLGYKYCPYCGGKLENHIIEPRLYVEMTLEDWQIFNEEEYELPTALEINIKIGGRYERF